MNKPKPIEILDSTPPDYSEWRCYVFGMGSYLVVRPLKGNEPNWFWRKMQWLCFGNKWIKESE